MKNYKEHLRKIKALIFDYDGVLSDGTVTILSNGEHLRTGYVKDGYAIQLALKKGYRIAVISGGLSESMKIRCSALGITDAFLGVQDKNSAFDDYLKQNSLLPSEVLFMGDDIPDFHVMKKSGIAACPADAAEEIKAISAYISPFGGGKGCVRDIIEQVLKVQDKWMDADAFTW